MVRLIPVIVPRRRRRGRVPIYWRRRGHIRSEHALCQLIIAIWLACGFEPFQAALAIIGRNGLPPLLKTAVNLLRPLNAIIGDFARRLAVFFNREVWKRLSEGWCSR